MMATRVLVAALLFGLAPSRAHAEAPSLRWSYSRGHGTDGCPDEPALRRAITAQLGRDPFAGDGRDVVALDVRRVNQQLRARIELRRDDGAILGARELRGNDCGELAPAMTLAIAMAIDALANPRPPVPPPPTLLTRAPEPAVTQARDDEVPRLVRPPRLPVAWNLSLGLLGAVDGTRIAAGMTLEVDVAPPGYSVGIELRGDLPAGSRLGGADVSASLWTGSIVPCLRAKVAALCGLVSLGREQVTVAFTAPVMDQLSLSSLWFGLGLRMALELPVHRVLSLRLHADVVTPLVRHKLPEGEQAHELYYITPPVTSSFGLALLAIFP